jgi:hypothetical protein
MISVCPAWGFGVYQVGNVHVSSARIHCLFSLVLIDLAFYQPISGFFAAKMAREKAKLGVSRPAVSPKFFQLAAKNPIRV